MILHLFPLGVFATWLVTVNISTESSEYAITEWVIPASFLAYFMVIIAPGQWIANSCAFVLSMVYLMYQIYTKYNVLPVPLIAASLLAIFYFTVGSRMLYQKFRDIYKVLFDNQKLIANMRRVLESFPEGVIIRSRSFMSKFSYYYTNNKFDSTIVDLKDSIANNRYKEIEESLESLKVTVNSFDDITSNNQVFITANEFLKQREREIKGRQILTSTCKILNDDFDISRDVEDETNYKFCTVKTLKVNWEGNPDSYLHVFIDTTDIYKLEKANNNIRCQKIMFASSSHEFRTPLNAILNSFSLIKMITQD
jgi:signal transduction histidine kinase